MPVRYSEIEPGLAIIQVDRPEVRNALDWESIKAFARYIETAHDNPDLKGLILTGSGDTFISGGDLKELSKYTSEADGHQLASTMSIALHHLERLPYLTLAAVNGPARGGGVEIALACDLRILSLNADLGFVQISLGLSPGWGGGQRLLRLVGYSHSLEWLASGRILTADEALSFGLANRVTPADQVLNTAIEMMRHMASQPQEAVRAIKCILRAGTILPVETAEALELETFAYLWSTDTHIRAVERYLDKK